MNKRDSDVHTTLTKYWEEWSLHYSKCVYCFPKHPYYSSVMYRCFDGNILWDKWSILEKSWRKND